jgi:hypothetical protein
MTDRDGHQVLAEDFIWRMDGFGAVSAEAVV